MSFPQCKKKSESELKGLETLMLYTKGPFTFFAKNSLFSKTACFHLWIPAVLATGKGPFTFFAKKNSLFS